jgi:hypothetical protein
MPDRSKRRALDSYPTPAWATLALLSHAEREGWIGPQSEVLDPACGAGSILDVARDLGHATRGLELHAGRAAAARARGHRVRQADALSEPWPACNAIVMNPPYSHAEAFISLALGVYRGRSRVVCALLRMTFLGSMQRADFHRANPAQLLVLPKRPRFDGQGNDTSDSVWFCWGPIPKGPPVVLEVAS